MKKNKEKQFTRICDSITYKTKLTPKCVHNSQHGSSSHNYFIRKASVTVEASIVIPVFIIVMMALSSIIYVIYSDTIIRQALYEEAKHSAVLAYDGNEYSLDELRRRVLERVGDRIASSSFVDSAMGGIDFSESDFSNREIIDLSVKYNVKIPYDLLGVLRYQIRERVVMHTLTGYVNGLNGPMYGGEIVYISETGSVYHRDINCSHIRLSIYETNSEEIDLLRNDAGARYRSCSACHSAPSDFVLYVTTDGTKYHNTLMCSGLTRNVRAIPLFQVTDRRPCSRCGY